MYINDFLFPVVIFFSFIAGFFSSFIVTCSLCKKKDERFYDSISTVRPGLIKEQLSAKEKLKMEYREPSEDEEEVLETINDYEEEEESISEESPKILGPVIKKNKREGILKNRIPKKDLSFTKFKSDLEEDIDYEECLMSNLHKENDAYKILKRKKDNI